MRIAGLMRGAAVLVGVVLLAGCAGDTSLEGPPEALGDFELGYAIVVTENAQKIGPSRDASPEEWKESLTRDITARFGRYEGERIYHIAVSLDGYALAVPGIPVLLSPKSAVVVSVNVWDDAKGAKINEEPKQITVLESLSGDTIVGSGLTKSREEQLANLSLNTAKLIEDWLVENRLDWFGETGDASAEITNMAVTGDDDTVPETAPKDTDGEEVAQSVN